MPRRIQGGQTQGTAEVAGICWALWAFLYSGTSDSFCSDLVGNS